MATYVALSRPPSFKLLISIGIPGSLRGIIEGGPPEGILSRFAAMFNEFSRKHACERRSWRVSGGRRSMRDHARTAFLLQTKTRARVTKIIRMLQNTLRPSASATAEHARADSYKVLETVLESIGA